MRQEESSDSGLASSRPGKRPPAIILGDDPVNGLGVARNLGVSGRSFYRHVAIPRALPAIVTGGKVSMSVALLLIVAWNMSEARHFVGDGR